MANAVVGSAENEVRRALVETVGLIAIEDDDLAELPTEIVLAALEGQSELENLISKGELAPRRDREGGRVARDAKRAYLSSLTVAGFRGVGPEVKLKLNPAPGLTVVTGRNGSGKSSLVEAMELALTGKTFRYEGRPSQRLEAWRNKHYSGQVEVRVGLATEGEGISTVGIKWAADAEREEFLQWSQKPGKRQVPGADPLGWQVPLEMYRPILTYDEVGRLFDGKPSALFDALGRVLGLDPLLEATDRIKRLYDAKAHLRTYAKGLKSDLRRELKGLGDSRADDAYRELGRSSLDLEKITKLATGVSNQSPRLRLLRALADRIFPPVAEIDKLFGTLSYAQQEVATLAVEDNARVRERLDILSAALRYRSHSQSTECMVCGSESLDDIWEVRVRQELGAAPQQDLLDEARSRLTKANDAVEAVITQLGRQIDLSDIELPGHIEFVDHLQLRPSQFTDPETRDWARRASELLAGIVVAAKQEADRLEDLWSPYALRIGEWVQAELAARPFDEVVENLDAARSWLILRLDGLRIERIQHVEQGAKEIWSLLRQESNVNLGSVHLKGTQGSPRRHVVLSADVDGEGDDAALSVMSQGELSALSLALFIPRATVPESPFRFLILDDPIQAMDPMKVDGFVKVLQGLAVTRQVVVFSHDDRLPTAIKQMGVDATFLGVHRKAESEISIEKISEPATRYVSDARAFLWDEKVPEDVKLAIIPGLGRMALESAAYQVFCATSYRNGMTTAQVENAWSKAGQLRPRVHIATSKMQDRDDGSWVDREAYRRSAIRFCNDGSHGDIAIVSERDVEGIAKTVRDLQAMQ